MHRGGQRPGLATLSMSKDAIPAPSTEAAAFTAAGKHTPLRLPGQVQRTHKDHKSKSYGRGQSEWRCRPKLPSSPPR